MGAFIYQWIDLIWLPVGWFAVHRQHRLHMAAFIVTCLVTMRTQIELMESIGFGEGILKLMDSPLRTRGLVIYGVVIALFLLAAHYSPRTSPIVFLAASISIYIFTFSASMIVMLL